MQNFMLKSALFGYSKASVCQYVAEVSKDFSDKLLAATEEHRQEKNELKQRIESLENELAEYKRLHEDISNALLEAQQCANKMIAEAEEEHRRITAENRAKHEAQSARLVEYKFAVNGVRSRLVKLLEEMDGDLAQVSEEADDTVCEFVEENAV